MTVGSDNPFPSILVQEHVDPSNPAAGYQRLFVDTDHILKMVDSSGTVTTFTGGTTVATDTLWDTAGDLVVGSGANTAAKLVIGAAGGALSRVNGAVAWNSGTSFPTAATGDRYWRTDLGMEAYYDGTRWLTVQTYEQLLASFSNQSASVANNIGMALNVTYDTYVVAFHAAMYHSSGTPASMYWTLELTKRTPGEVDTSLVTLSSVSNTSVNWTGETGAVGAVVSRTAHPILVVNAVKVSTPGNLYAKAHVQYRLVLT